MSKGDAIIDAQQERLARLAAMPQDTIDTSDITEATSGAWLAAEIGRFYRPLLGDHVRRRRTDPKS